MISTVGSHSQKSPMSELSSLGPRQIRVQVSSSKCDCGQRFQSEKSDDCSGTYVSVCGTVVGLGSQVSRWIATRRVFGAPATPHRSGESLAVLDFDQSHLLSSNIRDETALALTDEIACAWFALTRLAGAKKGDRILVTNPADPVSAAVPQVAEILGAQLIMMAPDSDTVERTQKLGAHRIIRCKSSEFDVVAEDLLKSIDIVVDASMENCQEVISAFAAPGGQLIALHDNISTPSWTDLVTAASSMGMTVFPVTSKLTTVYLREAQHRSFGDLLQIIAKERCPAFSARMHSEIVTTGH